MLDLKEFRKNFSVQEKLLKQKEPHLDLSFFSQEETIRKLKAELESLQAKRNLFSKEIGEKKKEKEDVSPLMQKVESIREKMGEIEKELRSLEEAFLEKFLELPNLPLPEVPFSLDPKDNVCLKMVGEKKEFSFPFKNHVELNESLHLFDFKRSAKITGSNWPLYTHLGAELEWALLQYMIDIHKKNGFSFILPPLLVKEETMRGVGQLPKFKNQLFKLEDEDFPFYLIPTAEAPLNGLHSDEILEEASLPLKYVSYTPCFRREAGAPGSQERGLIRMHQFNKVELFSLCTPESSAQIFEEMLLSAEKVLQGLEIHYRNMLLVTSDMSFASAKTIDIEVWLPGQNRYYEVSSVSLCTDYQARRAKIRYRNHDKKNVYVHTLNGSGVATSRLVVALLENNQQEDGSVLIPKVLQPYLKKERFSPSR